MYVLILGALSAVGRADSVVAFNEIHYHPTAGAAEWLELHNQLAVDVDLSEWSLAGGIDYVFPAGTNCFRDRAARPEGRTTPPTEPDERN